MIDRTATTNRKFWLVERSVKNGANLLVGVAKNGDLVYTEDWRAGLRFPRSADAERFMRHAMNDARLLNRREDVECWLVAQHQVIEKKDAPATLST